MYVYRISGDDYDSVAVDTFYADNTLTSYQYYMKNGAIVKSDKADFLLTVDGNTIALEGITTDSTDTVILPKMMVRRILPYALRNTKFRRLVVPLDADVELCNKSLYGSDSLQDYISLSRKVRYNSDALPKTVTRRVY
jgi:hypothetical protein